MTKEIKALAEVDDSRLVLVEGQAPGRQPFREPRLDVSGLPLGVAEHDHVVGVPDRNRGFPPGVPGARVAGPVPDPGGLLQPGRNGTIGLSHELRTQPGRTQQRTSGRGQAWTLPGLRLWHQPASFDVVTHNVRPHVATNRMICVLGQRRLTGFRTPPIWQDAHALERQSRCVTIVGCGRARSAL
jgi:hypothetical protein